MKHFVISHYVSMHNYRVSLSLAMHAALNESICAVMLIASAVVDAIQRVFILDAASLATNLVDHVDSIDDILQPIRHESVATVLRQCDSHHIKETKVHTINSSSESVPPSNHNDHRSSNWKNSNKMTRDHVLHAKNTYRCKRCGNYDHWYGDQNKDGLLPKEIPNSSSAIAGDKTKQNKSM